MRRVIYRYAGTTDRRRNRRYEAPRLNVSIGNRVYHSCNWSLGGIRIDGVPADCAVDDRVTVSFDGERNGRCRRGRSMARMVAVDEAHGQCAVEFLNLPDEAFRALQGLMTGSQH